MGDGMKFVAAAVLVVLAVAAALLAADVHAWQNTLRADDVQLTASSAKTRVPFALAERLLGTRNDVAARQALALYRKAAKTSIARDNAFQAGTSLARAETALADVARDPNRVRASQAETLLGVLVFSAAVPNSNPFSTERTGPSPDQISEAVLDLQNAVRDDPTNTTAKYDLELVIRSLAAQGVRVGAAQQSGKGSAGRRGASGGVPGEGY
jgi:hypothetical protein